MALAAEAIRATMIRNISTPTRTAGPSAPGEPPHVDTGTLRKSIFSEVHGDEIIVGSTAKHSVYLEVGTSRMAARPFMKKSLWDAYEKVKKILFGR